MKRLLLILSQYPVFSGACRNTVSLLVSPVCSPPISLVFADNIWGLLSTTSIKSENTGMTQVSPVLHPKILVFISSTTSTHPRKYGHMPITILFMSKYGIHLPSSEVRERGVSSITTASIIRLLGRCPLPPGFTPQILMYIDDLRFVSASRDKKLEIPQTRGLIPIVPTLSHRSP